MWPFSPRRPPTQSLKALRQEHQDACIGLQGAETQLAACIERVKEARTAVDHDELVLRELEASMQELRDSRIVKAQDYFGVRHALRDVKKGLEQRYSSLSAARTAVDKAEDARDELLSKVADLKEKLTRVNVVIPWTKSKNLIIR